MAPPLRRHDLVLDAEGRWCVVLEPGPVVAYCPGLGQRVALEPPVRVVEDPLAFLRVQETSSLVVALLAWHACGGTTVPARVRAAVRQALASGNSPRSTE